LKELVITEKDEAEFDRLDNSIRKELGLTVQDYYDFYKKTSEYVLNGNPYDGRPITEQNRDEN
jgi:hypothetical protein